MSYQLKRKGNSYVIEGSIGQHCVKNKPYLTISDDFPYTESRYLDGIPVHVFSKNKDLPAVYVWGRFGLFKDKFELSIDRHNFIVNESSKGDYTYTTVVKKDGSNHLISFVVILSGYDNGAWYNSFSFYMEYLPHYYPFESWSPSVIEERKEFISEFNERGMSAIQYENF